MAAEAVLHGSALPASPRATVVGCRPALVGAVAELCAAIFFSPGPSGVLVIWRFAGPACCCKISALARGAGPVAKPSRGGVLGEPTALPWEEWWPRLAGSSLAPLFASASQDFLGLDQAWVAVRARPDVVHTPHPQGKPMLRAVRLGRRALAELLRSSGATFARRSADELLHEAASRGGEATIDLLLFDGQGRPRADPWATVNARPTRHGGTPLDVATARGHAACGALLQAAGGRHSLHWAATHGLPEDLASWLQEGADVDERDGSGATPLWLAVRGRRVHGGRQVVTPLPTPLADDGNLQRCVRLLLEARAAVDAQPITLVTPLLLAASTGDVPLVRALLAARAEPLLKDRDGNTALQRAAAHPEVHRLIAASIDAGRLCSPFAGLAEDLDGPAGVFIPPARLAPGWPAQSWSQGAAEWTAPTYAGPPIARGHLRAGVQTHTGPMEQPRGRRHRRGCGQ